ncbi:MAG: hypothetical protein J7M25_06270 [Deltaproteobacteria bacterium]|nr:hypothetical protein [Deltaproteobacteria bacterium]
MNIRRTGRKHHALADWMSHFDRTIVSGRVLATIAGCLLIAAASGCSDDSAQHNGVDASVDAAALQDVGPGFDGQTGEGGVVDGAVDAEACPDPRPARVAWSRTNPNLIADPHFEDATPWYHYVHGEYQSGQQPLFDPSTSRTPGSGSIRLAYEDLENGDSDKVAAHGIPVEPGKVYTLSLYAKIESWPPPRLYIGVGYRDEDGHWTHNGRGGGRWGVSEVGEWQEVVGFFYPEPGDAFAQPSIQGGDSLDGDPNHVIWIDDVYFGEGKSFAEPPSAKTPFDGTMTRVDDLGNIELLRDGQWVPFFPLCIYADGSRPDWSVYSEQGFNCNMWTSSASGIRRAKEATSAFNPDGMVSGFQIAQYIGHDGWAYNDLVDLRSKIQEVKDQGLMGSLLFWYWDNEHVYGDWDVPVAVTSTIIDEDQDGNGNRMHPIYALNGNFGLTRIYQSSRQTLIDVTGTYMSRSVDGFQVQDMVGAQSVPPSIAQIQLGIGERFRPSLFAAIAVGARGMGHWRDRYGTDPVEGRAWWSQLPQIRRDIDAMLPLIRTPHWTDWSLTCDGGPDVTVGTRTMDCRGYVIAANASQDEVTMTCHISGLAYQVTKVVDFFSGDDLGTVTDGQFSLTIEAYGRTVVRLDP